MASYRTPAELKNCKLGTPSLLFGPLVQDLGSDKRRVLSPGCVKKLTYLLFCFLQLTLITSTVVRGLRTAVVDRNSTPRKLETLKRNLSGSRDPIDRSCGLNRQVRPLKYLLYVGPSSWNNLNHLP